MYPHQNDHVPSRSQPVGIAPPEDGFEATEPFPVGRMGTDPRDDTHSQRRAAKALVPGRAGDILLVRERREDGSTFWTLPGGGQEGDETLRACLRREIAEELQCDVTVGLPVGACLYAHVSSPGVVSCYTVFGCSLTGTPIPNAAEDIVETRWVELADLPDSLLDPFHWLLSDLRDWTVSATLRESVSANSGTAGDRTKP